MTEQEINQKDSEDEMDLEKDLSQGGGVKDKKQDKEVEFLLGLNEDKHHFLDVCLKTEVLKTFFSRIRITLLILTHFRNLLNQDLQLFHLRYFLRKEY
jgi:hypothetical protein